jgi:hypothetical protein
VDCATPALSRILLNHLRPANGWLGCRTRTFLNILPGRKKKRNASGKENPRTFPKRTFSRSLK